jgi:hypothetical protein
LATFSPKGLHGRASLRFAITFFVTAITSPAWSRALSFYQ